MSVTSPLRYPGGKRRLLPFITKAMLLNNMEGGQYVEPYAGGASIALGLLLNKTVKKIYINDLDRSIYAFWFCVLNHTKELCAKIIETPVTIEQWNIQKQIQLEKENASFLDLGFSTFFLNRTNRSGIINGGIIGGKLQTGNWKMDARYNKSELIRRIEVIGQHRSDIVVKNLDAIDFIEQLKRHNDLNQKTLIYFDPPYYKQGMRLYTNHYQHEDHLRLSTFIQNLKYNWMLTYDNADPIRLMYPFCPMYFLHMNYSVSRKEKGIEYLFFNKNFHMPSNFSPMIQENVIN